MTKGTLDLSISADAARIISPPTECSGIGRAAPGGGRVTVTEGVQEGAKGGTQGMGWLTRSCWSVKCWTQWSHRSFPA